MAAPGTHPLRRGTGQATSQIEFFVSCKGLRDADILSKSDPFAVASMGQVDEEGQTLFTEIGRTEVLENTSDPEFTKQFVADFHFNETQTVQVRIWDEDSVTADDPLGQVKFTLAALMAAPGMTLKLHLLQKGERPGKGSITIRGEEMAHCLERLSLTLKGIKLPNKDHIFGKSDPMYILSRLREDGEWQQVHRSEVIMDEPNPSWNTADLSMQELCNGDHLRPIKVMVWDWDKDGSHDEIGYLETSVKGLLENQGQIMELQGVKAAGKVEVVGAELRKVFTLLDYVKGGLETSLMVAIDFTKSNGNPLHSQSLHYIDQSGLPNQYQKAILSVGAILQEYDSDRMFPVYGFGGRLGPDGVVSHCFPICPRYDHVGGLQEVKGVEGILEAYAAALHSVSLAGPTLFSEVLQTAMSRANQGVNQMKQEYQVLLILTDGIINDMQETINCLVEASRLPLSVIIVGIGNADFTNMDALDGDNGVLTDSSGNAAVRDIVQFVSMDFYKMQGLHFSRLAADTIAEIPAQILSFFPSRGIVPNPPRQAVDGFTTADLPPPPPHAPMGSDEFGWAQDDDPPPPYEP